MRRAARVLAVSAGVSAGVAALAAVLPAGEAMAQQGERLLPPTVNETGEPPTIRMYIVAALLGALVVSANLIPSKRGHQD